jgi:hypothetical protein
MKRSLQENRNTSLESSFSKERTNEVSIEKIEGIRVGKVVNVDKNGRVFVDYTGNIHGQVAARYTSSVKLQTLCQAVSSKRDILLVFENNDPLRPIIVDILSSPLEETTQPEDMELKIEETEDIVINGRTIKFNAKDQIELKCGKASIILTRAGKVLIRGAYLLSRSSGVNRIKGGSVQIN